MFHRSVRRNQRWPSECASGRTKPACNHTRQKFHQICQPAHLMQHETDAGKPSQGIRLAGGIQMEIFFAAGTIADSIIGIYSAGLSSSDNWSIPGPTARHEMGCRVIGCGNEAAGVCAMVCPPDHKIQPTLYGAIILSPPGLPRHFETAMPFNIYSGFPQALSGTVYGSRSVKPGMKRRKQYRFLRHYALQLPFRVKHRQPQSGTVVHSN